MKGGIRISNLGDLWVLTDDVVNLLKTSNAISVFTEVQLTEIRDSMNKELQLRTINTDK